MACCTGAGLAGLLSTLMLACIAFAIDMTSATASAAAQVIDAAAAAGGLLSAAVLMPWRTGLALLRHTPARIFEHLAVSCYALLLKHMFAGVCGAYLAAHGASDETDGAIFVRVMTHASNARNARAKTLPPLRQRAAQAPRPAGNLVAAPLMPSAELPTATAQLKERATSDSGPLGAAALEPWRAGLALLRLLHTLVRVVEHLAVSCYALLLDHMLAGVCGAYLAAHGASDDTDGAIFVRVMTHASNARNARAKTLPPLRQRAAQAPRPAGNLVAGPFVPSGQLLIATAQLKERLSGHAVLVALVCLQHKKLKQRLSMEKTLAESCRQQAGASTELAIKMAAESQGHLAHYQRTLKEGRQLQQRCNTLEAECQLLQQEVAMLRRIAEAQQPTGPGRPTLKCLAAARSMQLQADAARGSQQAAGGSSSDDGGDCCDVDS